MPRMAGRGWPAPPCSLRVEVMTEPEGERKDM